MESMDHSKCRSDFKTVQRYFTLALVEMSGFLSSPSGLLFAMMSSQSRT